MRSEKAVAGSCVALALTLPLGGCKKEEAPSAPPPVAQTRPALGTTIVAAGERFDIGTPVMLWSDPGGYDAYREDLSFGPDQPVPAGVELAKPGKRYETREARTRTLGDAVARNGWTLENLRGQIDQFVLHYDACGCSKRCFRILHDIRRLSVHFMLDLDGVIYQTLDLKERAWHASDANDRSVGIEIANLGARRDAEQFDPWYARDGQGPYAIFPRWVGDPGIWTPDFVARPTRPDMIRGTINNRTAMQYDLTDEQYAALVKLTAGLIHVFPKITLTVPRGPDGNIAMDMLSRAAFRRYTGLIAHWHIDKQKYDPGPAFDWDRLTAGVRAELDAGVAAPAQ